MVTLRLAVVLTLLLAGTAEAAGTGVIEGTLTTGSAKLPASASRGEAQVLALDLDSLAYGAAAPVARSGRYRLTLPPGKWALRTSVAAFGKPYAAFTSAAIVTRADSAGSCR